MRRHAKAIVAVSAMLLTLALGVNFAGAIAPVVTIDAPSGVSYTSAHVSGTVDPQDNDTYWSFEYSKDPVNEGWSGFTFKGPIPAGAGIQNVSTDLTGLKPGTEYEVRLVANNQIDPEVLSAEPNPTFTTDPVGEPTVSIDPVTSITDDGAHFSGTINPNAPVGNPAAFDVKWHFECTPTCPDLSDNQTIAADSSNHVVEVDASDLDPNTDYEVRLVAENAGGPKMVSASFQTGSAAPIVQPLPPAVVDDDSAWIGAKVNPQNTATTYYIEYSSDPGFATSTKAPVTEDASAGSGNSLVFANHHAEGLDPGTIYYYRAVANGAGTTVGETESFETLSQPILKESGLPEGRVYEKVSPADKNGGDIFPGSMIEVFAVTAKAALDGDAVAYGGTMVSFAGDGGAIFPQYLARRGPNGWVTEGLSPRMESRPFLAVPAPFPWLSEDLSWGLVTVGSVLNQGDFDHSRNLYLRDNSSSTYVALDSPLSVEGHSAEVKAVARQGIHIVYTDKSEAGSDDETLWMWDEGQVRPVSVYPDGTPIPTTTDVGVGGQHTFTALNQPGENAVSADGSHVFFNVRFQFSQSTLYLREFADSGAETTLVAASERTGDDPTLEREVQFELAASDGRTAFFRSLEQLTDQSRAGVYNLQRSESLYRWNADSPAGSRLTDISAEGEPVPPGVLGTVGASEDGTVVYFVATGRLTPGATTGDANLYQWQEGSGLHFIANLGTNLEGASASTWSDTVFFGETSVGTYREARTSADGRFLTFTTNQNLTSYETNGTRQIYLYDNQDASLECVSCSRATPSSVGNSVLSSAPRPLGGPADEGECCNANSLGYLPRNLAADGTWVLFDSVAPLVPEDSNGRTDVYEWREGRIRLISTGDSAEPAQLLDVSANGSDVFFTTTQRLVPSDVDTARDLYDARIGGAAESPRASVPCVGDECQGSPSAPPSFETPSSAGFSGQGNQAPTARCAKRKVRRNGRCVPRKRKTRAKPSGKGQHKSGRSH